MLNRRSSQSQDQRLLSARVESPVYTQNRISKVEVHLMVNIQATHIKPQLVVNVFLVIKLPLEQAYSSIPIHYAAINLVVVVSRFIRKSHDN